MMGALLAIIIVIAIAVWAVGVMAGLRWERCVPATPRYALPKPPSGSLRTTVRKDGNARIEKDEWRFLWNHRTRHWFTGTGCPPHTVSESEFSRLRSEQSAEPQLVTTSGERQYWWWNDEFYWDNGQYAPADVRAIILKHQRQNRRELEHAHNLLAVDHAGAPRKREPISEDVRRFVFRRDEGTCQTCGSQELLQYDHILPVVMGGSNEPENLQLLCAPCNRAKSGKL